MCNDLMVEDFFGGLELWGATKSHCATAHWEVYGGGAAEVASEQEGKEKNRVGREGACFLQRGYRAWA